MQITIDTDDIVNNSKLFIPNYNNVHIDLEYNYKFSLANKYKNKNDNVRTYIATYECKQYELINDIYKFYVDDYADIHVYIIVNDNIHIKCHIPNELCLQRSEWLISNIMMDNDDVVIYIDIYQINVLYNLTHFLNITLSNDNNDNNNNNDDNNNDNKHSDKNINIDYIIVNNNYDNNNHNFIGILTDVATYDSHNKFIMYFTINKNKNKNYINTNSGENNLNNKIKKYKFILHVPHNINCEKFVKYLNNTNNCIVQNKNKISFKINLSSSLNEIKLIDNQQFSFSHEIISYNIDNINNIINNINNINDTQNCLKYIITLNKTTTNGYYYVLNINNTNTYTKYTIIYINLHYEYFIFDIKIPKNNNIKYINKIIYSNNHVEFYFTSDLEKNYNINNIIIINKANNTYTTQYNNKNRYAFLFEMIVKNKNLTYLKRKRKYDDEYLNFDNVYKKIKHVHDNLFNKYDNSSKIDVNDSDDQLFDTTFDILSDITSTDLSSNSSNNDTNITPDIFNDGYTSNDFDDEYTNDFDDEYLDEYLDELSKKI